MRWELLVQASFALAGGLLYAWVARLVQHRSLSDEARAANRLFVTWWASFSILYALVGLWQLAFAFGYADLPMSMVLIEVVLVLLCLALWGLLGYLLYLYTGSHRWFAPLGVGYALLAASLLYLIAWMDPSGFKEGGFSVQLDYAREPSPRTSLLLGLLFAVPVVAAAVAYGSLWFRVKEPEPRYRIGMVAGAFLGWFGWSIVSTVLQLQRRFPDSVPLYVWNQALALLVPLVIVMAFRPPAWVRARIAGATERA